MNLPSEIIVWIDMNPLQIMGLSKVPDLFGHINRPDISNVSELILS